MNVQPARTPTVSMSFLVMMTMRITIMAHNVGDGVVDDGDGDGHDDSVNSGQPISPVRAPVAELTLSLR